MADTEQTLSTDEMEALREMALQDEPDEPRETRAAQVKVLAHNFRQPGQLSSSQLRALKVVHEFFAKRLGEVQPKGLSVRQELKLQSVETISYSSFMGSLSNPCFLMQLSTRFDDPFLLDIDLKVMRTLVARLLGDDTEFDDDQRLAALSSIEQSIASSLMEAVLPTLSQAWELSSPVDFALESIDSDPRFVQAMPDDHPVVSLTFQLTVGSAQGSFTLCYPLEALQELVEGMSHRMTGDEDEPQDAEQSGERILTSLKCVPIELRAELGCSTVLTSQLMELRRGDILLVNRKIHDPLEVFVENTPLFKARLGRQDDVLALQLSKRRS